MKRLVPILAIAGAAVAAASLAQKTTSKTQTTVESQSGVTTTTVTGEVVRYEPGKVIVVRQPDTRLVTYTLRPSLEAPAEVRVGGRVWIFTEPAEAGSIQVTRIATSQPGDPRQTTIETQTMEKPSGARTTTVTKSTTITGEVVRLQPGQTIVLRQPDEQVVTYTLGPSLVVPAEVEVGRHVSIVTEPSASGAVIVSRITTESVTLEGERKTTTQKTELAPGGETRTQTTTAYGTVTAYEPGNSITLIQPDKTTVTYVIDRESALPAGVAIGREVTVRTTTIAGSEIPVVRKVTYTTRSKTLKKKSY